MSDDDTAWKQNIKKTYTEKKRQSVLSEIDEARGITHRFHL